MTRKDFDDFLKHKGRVKYRGRLYTAASDKPAGMYESIYLETVNKNGGRGWFIASKQEILSAAYEYIPNEQQLTIKELNNDSL